MVDVAEYFEILFSTSKNQISSFVIITTAWVNSLLLDFLVSIFFTRSGKIYLYTPGQWFFLKLFLFSPLIYSYIPVYVEV